MTERDRKVLAVVLVLIVFGGFWFLVVRKKQAAIKDAQAAQAQAQTDLDLAKTSEEQAKQLAKLKPASYNKLVRLGKAVPNDDDFQSLLVQINDITDDSNVIFASLSSNKSDATTVGAGESSSCDTGGGATGGTGATAATAPTPAPAPSPATGSTGGSSGATGSSTGETVETTETAASCASAPTLTDISASSAGLTKYEYQLTFQGEFYELHEVFNNILDLVTVHNGKVGVTGRLLDIGQIDLSVGEFPFLNASVMLNGYSIPATADTGDSAAAAAATAATATGTSASQ